VILSLLANLFTGSTEAMDQFSAFQTPRPNVLVWNERKNSASHFLEPRAVAPDLYYTPCLNVKLDLQVLGRNEGQTL
jgi:hypothetical protein